MIPFFIGLVSYILAGMGLGGGVILIPLLTGILKTDRIQAQYISLLAYIPMGLILLFSSRKNNLNYKIVSLVPFGILGAISGAICAKLINEEILKKFYGVFLIVFGLNLCLNFILKRLKNKKKC